MHVVPVHMHTTSFYPKYGGISFLSITGLKSLVTPFMQHDVSKCEFNNRRLHLVSCLHLQQTLVLRVSLQIFRERQYYIFNVITS